MLVTNSSSLPVKGCDGLLESVLSGGSNIGQGLSTPSVTEQLEQHKKMSRGKKSQFICRGTWFNRVLFFF